MLLASIYCVVKCVYSLPLSYIMCYVVDARYTIQVHVQCFAFILVIIVLLTVRIIVCVCGH